MKCRMCKKDVKNDLFCEHCGEFILAGIKMEAEAPLMPYPSEHACRLREPSDFQDNSFKRVNGERKHNGKAYDVIFGKLKTDGSWAEQAYRYPKDSWKVDDARAHCTSHKGKSFEPASGAKDCAIGGYQMKASKDSDEVEIIMYQDIGCCGLSADQFKKDLTEKASGKKNITLRINSYGGEVFDGFAIYNQLMDHPASKKVIVDGIAGSIASVIAMAADQGKLIMHENAQMMIHDPSVLIVGNAADLRNVATVLDGIKESAIKAYQRHASGLDRSELWDMMAKESYLTASRAKEVGLADEILEAITVEEPPTNMKKVPANDVKEKIFNYIIHQSNHVGQTLPTNKGESIMKCKHCGKEITDGVTFCPHCGKAVAEPVAVATVVPVDVAGLERARIMEITSRCDQFKLPVDFRNDLIDKKITLEVAIGQILDKVSTAPVVPDAAVKVDEKDKFRAHAIASISMISGLDKTPETQKKVREGGEPITSLHGLMRKVLQMNGVDATSFSAKALVERAIKMAGTGTSDLPYILADVANKALLNGFVEAPTTYQGWCGTREVPDFKQVNLVKLSTFSDVFDMPEGMPFKEGKFSDKKEVASVGTKGVKFTLSRQAMINDDLSALTRTPAAITGAMARNINKSVYDKLLGASFPAGPTMLEDGLALFHSTHANLRATSGLPSVANIGAANAVLMMTKLPLPTPDAVQQYTNLQARYLITGVNNMLTCEQILNTPFDPAKNMAGVYNPFTNGRIVGVFDAYLQAKLTAASKANAWYLACDPAQMDTFEIVYLAGNRMPTLRGEPSGIGEALGFSWDCFFDVGIAVPDWRGMQYNDGAV